MTINLPTSMNNHLSSHDVVQESSPIEDETRELREVLQKIVRNAGALLEVNHCSVALLDPLDSSLVTLAALGKDGSKPGSPRRTRFQISEGVAGWVAEHGEPLILNDVSRDARFKRLGNIPVGSMVCAPLVHNGAFVGTLTASSPLKDAFTPHKLHLLTVFADQAVLAIVNVRQAERVRADQEHLRAILTTSSDGIAQVDAQGRFSEVNPAFARLFGIDATRIVGTDCMEVFASMDVEPGDDWQYRCEIQAALLQRQPLPYMELDLLIHGVARTVGLSITPVSGPAQPFSVLMVRDVTAIRDAARTKANFLSMITHELRSPLNAINGYLDLSLNGVAGDLNEQQREFMQRARAGSEHLYALVEDLLLVSRADAGQLRLNRDVLDLDEIMANAVEELELSAVDNGIAIMVDIPSQFPALYADAVRLQQVLRNLISNALRFTPSGGTVAISAHIADAGDEKVVEISVKDTGCGIAPEHQQRIFERFYQVPRSGASQVGGQGLGLAIVKMIVELHGGQIKVESAPDQGSSFTFTLDAL